MVFPLTERYEAEVDEVVRHEKIEKKVAGDLPVVCPAEDLKCVDKSPSFWMKFGKGNLKTVEDLNLKIGKGET